MLTYGIMGGFGVGCIYLPAVVACGYYFEKRRALATGLMSVFSLQCASFNSTFFVCHLSFLVFLFFQFWIFCVSPLFTLKSQSSNCFFPTYFQVASNCLWYSIFVFVFSTIHLLTQHLHLSLVSQKYFLFFRMHSWYFVTIIVLTYCEKKLF